jgi:regulator of nucleoside diphosphate kinase
MSLTPPSADTTLPELHITEQDLARLLQVVERHIDGRFGPTAQLLEAELERARVVPQAEVPPDVVTMRSLAMFEDQETGKQRELQLVYPDEANPEENKVSILAPIGVALLGLRVGDSIRWPMPGGRHTRFKLLAVKYQPEAAGDFDL